MPKIAYIRFIQKQKAQILSLLVLMITTMKRTGVDCITGGNSISKLRCKVWDVKHHFIIKNFFLPDLLRALLGFLSDNCLK
jgi:hypothetical protein